jgi:hypothetical protein
MLHASMSAPGQSEPWERSEEIRAYVVARAERRFRGLTETERDLLDWTTRELVSELLSAECQRRGASSASNTAKQGLPGPACRPCPGRPRKEVG